MQLGRYVEHDQRSRDFALDDIDEVRKGVAGSVRWTSKCRILNQGDLGACVGYAATACLGSEPNWYGLPTAVAANYRTALRTEAMARGIYSMATELDGIPGKYPPTDTGSSGLAGAKALHRMGYCSGYLHAFSLEAAIKALQIGPLMLGTNWYEGMSKPVGGLVQISGDVVGGHEYVCYGYDADSGIVHCQNSWGKEWGSAGLFAMDLDTLERLLDEKGDATQLVPLKTKAPLTEDAKLWAAMQAWAKAKGLA